MLNLLKHFFRQSWLLIVSSLVFGMLIAVTNAALDPMIQQNKKDKINNLMSRLITGATKFEIVVQGLDVPGQKGKILKTDVYQGKNEKGDVLGYSFIASGPGFADKIELVIAADGAFEKFLGFNVLSSSETPGFGDKINNASYSGQFVDLPVTQIELVKAAKSKPNQIVAITGATVSSDAVVAIFNNYSDIIKKQLQAKGLIK
jgi:Na+-translocating ferredoxin:NAD+ oxidoreductase subunit G